jgi:hypothetical protein
MPLLPWLPPRSRFIEPCAGAGKLVEHLTRAGHVPVLSLDLPVDARTARYRVAAGEMFVSNPPFWGCPKDLHPLIENLSNQAPAWLLLSADWLHNKSSAPLMPRLRMIVSIGRIKWIEGSLFAGKDNAVWCLFDRPSGVPTIFVGRTISETPVMLAAAE